MFSNRIECGTPNGFSCFMCAITHRLLNALFPVISIFPTLTLGPSFTLKVSFSEEGGTCSITGSTVAYWRPRSDRNSFSTTAARWILFGSYCDSTVSPTLRSLNRSRISDTDTEWMPS